MNITPPKYKILIKSERYVFYTIKNTSTQNDQYEFDNTKYNDAQCERCVFEPSCLGRKNPHPESPCHEAFLNNKFNKRITRRYTKIADMLCTLKKRPKYLVSLNSDLKVTDSSLNIVKYWLKRFAAKLKVKYPKLWFFYKIEICEKRLVHLHLALRLNKHVHSTKVLDELIRKMWKSICKIDKDNCALTKKYVWRIHRMYFCKPEKKNLDKELMLILKKKDSFGFYGNAFKSNGKIHAYEVDKEYYDQVIKPIIIDYVHDLGRYRAGGEPNPKTIEMIGKGAGALNDISKDFKKKMLKVLSRAPKYAKAV